MIPFFDRKGDAVYWEPHGNPKPDFRGKRPWHTVGDWMWVPGDGTTDHWVHSRELTFN
jgi:hypothetical protein